MADDTPIATTATTPPPAPPATPTPPAAETKRSGGWRTPVSIILLVLAILTAPLFVVSLWVRGQITDTDRYVRTVAPLADKPEVQQYVATEISTAIIEQLDPAQKINELLPPALSVLAPTLTSGVDGFINSAANRFTESPAFKKIWVEANRTGHRVVSRVLTGDIKATELKDGALTLDLGVALRQFQTYLVEDRGFALAGRIDLSNVDRQIVIADSQQLKDLEQARNLVGLLKPLSWVLGIALIAFSVASVWLARDRRYALIRLGLGFAVTMLLVAVAINVAQNAFLGALSGGTVPRSVSAALFDAVASSLKAGFRVVFWGGLLIAGLVLLLPQIARRPPLVRPAQVIVAVAGAGLFIAWDNPTWLGAILIVIAVVAVIVAIEVAYRRALATGDQTGDQTGGGSTLSPSSAS